MMFFTFEDFKKTVDRRADAREIEEDRFYSLDPFEWVDGFYDIFWFSY